MTRSPAPTPPDAAAAGVAASGVAESVAHRPAARHVVRRTVRHATLRRAGSGVTARLEFEQGAGVRRVQAILVHHGRTLASAHRGATGGHAALHLRVGRGEVSPAAGAYDLLTITTDHRGVATSQVTRVTLH